MCKSDSKVVGLVLIHLMMKANPCVREVGLRSCGVLDSVMD